MTCLGVDGCPEGWIVAEAPDLRTTPTFWIAKSFGELAARAREGAYVCIDVPIGLSDRRRECDGAAREWLRGRASCVFTPPCRAALDGRGPAEMREINVRVTGRSLSAQLLGIVDKIRRVDESMTPALQRRVKETHPEVVFSALGDGGALPRKQSADGRRARLALLPKAYARAAPTREHRPFPAAQVRLDDYLDALACLCTAVRLARGDARRLPAAGGEHDARGLEMAIWY